ncbi:MAG TPA: hypothetical protein VMS63_00950 [Gaiellaceae bacterium]|jgi:hypothetical protein|nr:hypothetical protein [Gaiellaceae bacterium]
MRMLLAALGFAAAVVPTAAAGPRPQTLWQNQPHQPISAFAQDGRLLAWFTPSTGTCNQVTILDLGDGTHIGLPSKSTQNVTCRWAVVPPVRLALAGTNALWTLREAAPAPLPFDYVLGAGVRDPKERRFQEIAHASRGAGLWLGGIAGDTDTLVYAVTSVDYVNEVTCLSDPTAPGACAMKIAGGGVYRVVGRQPPQLVPGTTAAMEVAAADSTVAFVSTATIGERGAPLASAEMPIEVRDAATGTLVARVEPQGTPIAIALTAHLLATLERTPLGLQLAWYDLGTSALSGSVPVPKTTSPVLSASDQLIVFEVGRSIRSVNPTSHRVSTLTRAGSTPIGLSVEGSRIAWAENIKGRGRIRSLTVPAGG